jgi:ribonuclease BN (tRNA processing enzyme)
VGIPGAIADEDRDSWISQADLMNLQPSRLFGEVEEGGRDIDPVYDHPSSSDGAPVWEVEDEEEVKVFAAPMSHSVPCVGYVVQEKSKPGRLRDEIVTEFQGTLVHGISHHEIVEVVVYYVYLDTHK